MTRHGVPSLNAPFWVISQVPTGVYSCIGPVAASVGLPPSLAAAGSERLSIETTFIHHGCVFTTDTRGQSIAARKPARLSSPAGYVAACLEPGRPSETPDLSSMGVVSSMHLPPCQHSSVSYLACTQCVLSRETRTSQTEVKNINNMGFAGFGVRLGRRL